MVMMLSSDLRSDDLSRCRDLGITVHMETGPPAATARCNRRESWSSRDDCRKWTGAVEAWQTGGFDLILIDVQMPERSGLEATASIREVERRIGGDVPIVAPTARRCRATASNVCRRGWTAT
jgi:CheY-like chemotaxis protein